jgi:hypothetical protein
METRSLVDPGHRLGCGFGGAGGSIPLGNVGQRESHIDVCRAQPGQVVDTALRRDHIDARVRIAGLEMVC